jgi:hypothetical protein
MRPSCPTCGSTNIRLSKNRNWMEWLGGWLGVYPARCRACGERFRDGTWAPSWFARCPKCFREELSDWAEPYRYPTASRWLLKLGAKAHRCSPCRYNFVSFLRRRSNYVPSWRRPPAAETKHGGAAEIAEAKLRH